MALYVRKTTEAEDRQLRTWSAGKDPTLRHRAKVVLLSSQGLSLIHISEPTRPY